MGVGSMGGLYLGVSGLRVNHMALTTTAHNLSNLDSEGYSRQQVLMRDASYSKYATGAVNSMQLGLGTDMAKIRQVRDTFADKQYRLELVPQVTKIPFFTSCARSDRMGG